MALVTVQLKFCNSNEIFRELSIFQLNVFCAFYWISKIYTVNEHGLLLSLLTEQKVQMEYLKKLQLQLTNENKFAN